MNPGESKEQNPEATIDRTVIESLWEMVESDRDIFAEIINCYLEDAPTLVQSISIAIASQNAQLLQQSAHQLKSSSAYVGATLLSELSRELEFMGKNNDLRKSFQIVLTLEEEHQRVAIALTKELEYPTPTQT